MATRQANDATGTVETALSHARALLRRDPAMAEAQAREILRVLPGHPQATALLGQACAALGRGDEAIAALRLAVERDPESPEAWRTLGDQLILAGDAEGADAAYARQIRASVNDPELCAAATALCDNRLDVAERILKPYLKRFPTDVAAIRMLAELAGRLGRYKDAEALLRRATELAPSFAPARHNLATALHRQGKSLAALGEIDRLMADDGDNPSYRNLKAAILGRIGDYEAAVALYRSVLDRFPKQPKVWMSLGHALKTLGRQDESIAAYRRGIEQLPTLGEVWWSLANLKTLRFTDADITAMRAALAAPGLGEEDRFHLEFALGKAEEDRGDYARSFAHYAEGNRRRRALLDYEPDDIHRSVERSRDRLGRAFFAEREGWGCPAPDPIFVVSLPRSGSTLVEQILASHSAVEGTMELSDIAVLASRLGPGGIGALDRAEAHALGEEYIERTRIQRREGRPRFVDKMPNNWLHVGLIRLILPNATIIDARRHPLGCCFSNFKQHFARGQHFAYDLTDLGRYYRDYVGLMGHFDEVLPGHVHRVVYERMIDDTEAEIRALLAHADLPFEPACLQFHATERAVRTASSEQVRQPIFREGVEQWRHFEPWLDPLKRALGPVLDKWDSCFDAK